MRRNVAVTTLVCLFAAVFLCISCAFQVSVTNVAMVSTLGRPGEPITEPGLYGKAPWPFQRVYLFDRRVQLLEGDYREVLTRDGLNLVVRFYAAWAVENPNRFYEWVGFRLADGEKILNGLLDKYSSDVIGKHPLGSFVSIDGDEAGSLAAIETDIQNRMSEEVAKYGIAIKGIGVEHLGFPESITKDVFRRMIADRGRLTQKIRSEGERDAKLKRTEADQLRAEKLSKAEADAIGIRGQGESEAYRFFDVYQEDPEFALFLRKLEALEATLKSKTTIILDRDIPPYDLLDKRALGDDGKGVEPKPPKGG